MVSPLIVAGAYLIVGAVVVPIMFMIFRAQYTFVDVVVASAAAALLSLVPTVGSVLSFLAMVLVLNWRCGAALFPDIVLSVAVARLAMVAVLLPFTRH